MSGDNVRVCCRFRPMNAKELEESLKADMVIDTKGVQVKSKKGNTHTYTFDQVFDEEVQQEEIYRGIAQPMISDIFEGYNCTIFAYGQTSCLHPETLVLRWDGSEAKVGDLREGDQLLGDDSQPRTVSDLVEGEDLLYEIQQWHPTAKVPLGDTYRVNGTHVLTLAYYAPPRVVEEEGHYLAFWSEEGEEKTRRFSNLEEAEKWVNLKRPFQVFDLPLCQFLDRPVEWQARQRGVKALVDFPERPVPFDPYLYGQWLGGNDEIGAQFPSLFEEHETWSLRIPEIYRVNSVQVRIQLLLGFQEVYSPFDLQLETGLMEDLLLICSSLGLEAYSHLGNLVVADRLSLSVLKIRPCGQGPYRGFALDGNRRFLLRDYTRTHNSGKTHTMTGYSHLVDNRELLISDSLTLWHHERDMGLVPRLVKDLFRTIRETSSPQVEFMVRVSYLEIYLEKIRDLLAPRNDNLKIRESRKDGIWVEGLTKVYVANFEEILRIMRKGEANRTVASTAMNSHSSRSHSVLIITLIKTDQQKKTTSRMVFVDLAGSEKAKKTLATGDRLKEAQYTNSSLLSLGQVIRAIVDKAEHVPYRNSKLTRLLTDSLGGNSKTCLVITCSKAVIHLEETISTLLFGYNCKSIRNRPKANIEMDVSEYQRLLAQAQEKIATQQMIINDLKSDIEELIKLAKAHDLDVSEYEKNYNIQIPASALRALRRSAGSRRGSKLNLNSGEVISPRSPLSDSESEDFETLQKTIAELETKSGVIADLQKTITVLHEKIERYRDRQEELADEVSQQKSEVDSRDQVIHDLVEELGKISKMEDYTNELEQTITAYKQKEQNWTVSTITQQQEIERLNRQIRNITLEKKAEQADLLQPQTRREEDRDLQRECESLRRNDDYYRKMLSSKEKHIAVLEGNIRDANERNRVETHRHRQQTAEHERRIRELENQLLEKRSEGSIARAVV